MRLISELRRRNVIRMAVLYVIAAWLIMQVAEVLIGLANLPQWVGPAVLGLLALGFPIALIFSWFYELTGEGIALEKDVPPGESITHATGRRLDFLVISLLSAALILFAYDKWWQAKPPQFSIAVLPFVNMSNDPDQEYFSDGISEELLNLLAQIPQLKVISRTSAFSLKGEKLGIAEIARRLKVAHVLEGSVRRSGDKVRITAQLIKADDGYHLWSSNYDREMDDIFAVQGEIAGAIRDALKVELALETAEAVPPMALRAANTDAYDAYLRARELVHLRGNRNLEEAVLLLQRSLRMDERYAPAHAQLAIASLLLSSPGAQVRDAQLRQEATVHLERARELQPDHAETQGGWALLALTGGDPEAAAVHARNALQANPSNTDALNWLTLALTRLGRRSESVAALEQLLVIDPLNVTGRFNHSWYLGWMGQVDKAHEIADQLLALNRGMGYLARAQIALNYQGDIALALRWFLSAHAEESRAASGQYPVDTFGQYPVNAFIWVGEYDEARRINSELAHRVDIAQGRFDAAIQTLQGRKQPDPDNPAALGELGDAFYQSGQLDRAFPLYQQLRSFVPAGTVICCSYERMMRLALASRRVGDEEGALAVAEIVTQDLDSSWRLWGAENQFLARVEAMIAAFEADYDRAINELEFAIKLGLRDAQFFSDPAFAQLENDPRFIALQRELAAILDREHARVLQLLCFNNPTPDTWQPLPATCAGAKEERRL